MMTLLRKRRQWLFGVILVLALPFIFYFTKSDLSAMRSDQFARIYDRNVSIVEYRRDARLCDLARQLGMLNFVQDLAMAAQSREDLYTQFTLNLIILQHEMARLGIRPSSKEIIDEVRNLPAFRGAAGFDPQKYDEFTQNFLSPNGFTDSQIEELVGDQIALNKIRELVGAGVSISEAESKAIFDQMYGQITVSVARLRLADFGKDLKISDDDVRKYYDAHKADLKTEEKRKVEFVTLVLTDEQKKLAGKERVDVLQKLADRANDFTQGLLEKGAEFKKVAEKFQLAVRETGEFTAAAPDAQLKTDPQLTAAAFQLKPEEPISDAIQVGDGFYISHLTGVAEPRPLSIEEAKPKIVDAIKTARSRELLSNKGTQAAYALRESIKSGTPLPAALEKANLKAEKLPPFSVADDVDVKPEAKKAEPESSDLPTIKRMVGDLNTGDVSEFYPSNDGGWLAIVEKRVPPDPEKGRQSKATFDERYLGNKRRIAFYEWLRERQHEAGLVTTKPEDVAVPKQS